MSRPKPRVLLEDETADGRPLTVIDCPGVWVLTYRGQPVQIRTGASSGYPGPKYQRACWTASPAHAFNMAAKMNRHFNTDLFGVGEVRDLAPLDDESAWDEWIGE